MSSAENDLPTPNTPTGPNGDSGHPAPNGEGGRPGWWSRVLWRAFFGVLLVGAVAYVLVAIVPAFKSPTSRVYASRLGYPSLMRLLDRPIEVEVEKAGVRRMVKTTAAEGRVAYLNEVPVKSEVQGIVTDILVEPGQEVHKGDVLIRLNTGGYFTRTVELARDLARAELDEARVELERERQLIRTHATTEKKLELAELKVKHAEIVLARAEEEYKNSLLSRSKRVVEGPAAVARDPQGREIDLLATLSGTVFERNVQPGENLDPQQNERTLLFIGDRPVFQAVFDQRYASALHLGDRGKFYLRAYPGVPFEGEVVRLGATVGTGSTPGESEFPYTFRAWLAFSTESLRGRKLVRGMNGYCVFERPFSALAVPESALMRYSGRTGTVLAVDPSNHLRVKEVTYTGTDEGWVAVEQGLTEGERVVLQGQGALQPGDRVSLREEAPASATPAERGEGGGP